MAAKTSPLLLVLPFAVLAGACGKAPDSGRTAGADAAPVVLNARVLLPPPGSSMAAGYFDVSNPGATALELRAVRSASFGSVEMHETREEGGMSRMRELEEVELPAGGRTSFEPGGKHLMLMDSKLDAAKPAQDVPMSLEFVAPDGSKRIVEVRFALEAATDDASAAHH
jgi:copper(I)-binding protein